MSTKLIAVVLAAAAVMLAGVAVIVVATRHAPAPATIDTHTVAAGDVIELARDPQVRFDAQGAHVDDPALAGKLSLAPGDTIVELSGVPILKAFDVDRVIMLNGAELYVELVRAGSTVIERWKLVGDLREARRDSVALTRPSPSPPVVAPDPDPLLDTIVRDDDTHVHLPRATVDAILANPMKYATQARVVPAMENGKPAGFKLYSIRPSSVYARLGLQNGDRLDAVNGMRLDNSQAALGAYTKLRDATRLDLSLTRRGQPFEITFQIN